MTGIRSTNRPDTSGFRAASRAPRNTNYFIDGDGHRSLSLREDCAKCAPAPLEASQDGLFCANLSDYATTHNILCMGEGTRGRSGRPIGNHNHNITIAENRPQFDIVGGEHKLHRKPFCPAGIGFANR